MDKNLYENLFEKSYSIIDKIYRSEINLYLKEVIQEIQENSIITELYLELQSDIIIINITCKNFKYTLFEIKNIDGYVIFKFELNDNLDYIELISYFIENYKSDRIFVIKDIMENYIKKKR